MPCDAMHAVRMIVCIALRQHGPLVCLARKGSAETEALPQYRCSWKTVMCLGQGRVGRWVAESEMSVNRHCVREHA